ncbi:hypothetical protein H5410_051922 [Solanum commersonii]|uniref:Uncharacterized protein n=1 Tax=Solanum commersonii TaxID=4109 RepID=A0A9J5X0U2_SOLCO|nr:hypothetical protein H5410_051922 [Solanum commersonii]
MSIRFNERDDNLSHHVKSTTTQQGSGHAKPEETYQKWECPIAPPVPKGQTRRFGVKAVTKKGRLGELGRLAWSSSLLTQKSATCTFVQEFSANWAPEARSHYVTSMAQWTKHSGKRYHQSLPYAHMLWRTPVWLKVVLNYLIPGLHYIDITRDWVCLVYALMTGMELNIGAIMKSSMWKAWVHKGHMYVADIPKENIDYIAPLYPAPVDITQNKGSDTEFGPTLTTAEHHRRDELIMARMYGLEMLRHQNGYHDSTDMQLGEVERRYPLNDHARALLGIGPEFWEPIENDIPTNEENMRTSSDVDSDSKEKIDPAQVDGKVNGGNAMED